MADEQESTPLVWFLVERSDQHAAIEEVAGRLDRRGIDTEVVTITEVIGSAAREAVAGGAERILRGLRVAWQGEGGEEDFLSAIRRARPDLLVVTSGRHARPLSLVESITGAASVQVGLPLDFNLSALWLNGSIEAFLLPDEGSMGRLEQAGYDGSRLFRAGPPILPNVEGEIDREAVRAEMGFGDRTAVLVRADSFDPTTLDRLVFQATLVEGECQFVFHHNGDGAVAQALRRAADQHGLPAAMFGRVPDRERYLAAADAILAAPGEPYLPEIVRLGQPLFLVGPEGDYSRQIDVLTEDYAAGYVADSLRVGSELERFLEPDHMQEVEEVIAEQRLAPSNDDVVDALDEALDRVEAWKAQRPVAPGVGPEPAEAASGEQDGDQLPVKRGPFETIGAGGGEEEPTGRPSGEAGGRRGISRAEAKDQLAELILIERDLERRLSEMEREQERWRNRLDLAREWGEEDLADEAKGILREYIDDAADARDELDDVRRQKEKLTRAARRGGEGSGGAEGGGGGDFEARETGRASELEDRFSEMEIDRELDDLRDRIEGELGD